MSELTPHEHWRIAVETGGELIVAIETEMLAGRELSEQDEATIEESAHHLLSFLGRAATRPTQEGVKVKALEWRKTDAWAQATCPAFGAVSVFQKEGSWNWSLNVVHCRAECSTQDEAIEELEQERMRRILSTLDPSPAAGESEIVEALERLSTFECMTPESWGLSHPEIMARVEFARAALAKHKEGK